MRIILSGGKFLFYLLLLAALAYGGYRVYRDYVSSYVENHPAGQKVRPDVFGR